MRREWRCMNCGKLLGILEGVRLHIKFTHAHEYLVGTPAISICRGCGTLNEFTYKEVTANVPQQ